MKEKLAKKAAKSETSAVDTVLCSVELGGKGDLELMGAAVDKNLSFETLYSPDIWICDTGTSCHSTNSDVGAIDIHEGSSEIIGHDGKAVSLVSLSSRMVLWECMETFRDEFS